mmetsp:Transcript_5417/g.9419  ORF Transcript_5417/g.9419 Transcript_5417/m.9419 type:complete len:124 (+) Transcript_5417:100-471(+)
MHHHNHHYHISKTDELIAVGIVLGLFLVVILTFACILHLESVGNVCKRLVGCLCCQTCKPEIVHTYSDLNSLLLDADQDQRGRLVSGGQDITVLGFFQNVLEDDPTPKQTQTINDASYSEPLL